MHARLVPVNFNCVDCRRGPSTLSVTALLLTAATSPSMEHGGYRLWSPAKRHTWSIAWSCDRGAPPAGHPSYNALSQAPIPASLRTVEECALQEAWAMGAPATL
jgi:hypothetical protein